MKPFRNGVLSVSADVRVNDDDGQKAGQCYQNHVHAEIRSCTPTQNAVIFSTMVISILTIHSLETEPRTKEENNS